MQQGFYSWFVCVDLRPMVFSCLDGSVAENVVVVLLSLSLANKYVRMQDFLMCLSVCV